MTENRRLAFRGRVGSHEYNLNTKDSDEDYKVFVLPTFDELYYNKTYSSQEIGLKVDVDAHDIRKLGDLFTKANLNFLEVLYSDDVKVNPEFPILNEIFGMRDEIVVMNLAQLFRACRGMSKNKMSLLEKGTEGTQHLVDLHGYDTKQAQHAFRSLNFLNRFYRTEFKDFKKAIWYDSYEKVTMMSIKNGEFTLNEFREIMEDYNDAISTLEETYTNNSFNGDTKQKLDSIIYEVVKKSILES